MLSIIFIIIGLSLLILVHEWGHFLAARWFGLLVEEFGIGFPPRLFSKKIKGTIFSFNAIPLGGFVRIYGENAGVGGDIQHLQKSFAYQSAGRRAVIIIAGVLANFLAGWLIISGIFWIGSPSLIKIDLIQPDSPAAIAGLMVGDQILGFESADKLIGHINDNRGGEVALRIKRPGINTFEELEIKAAPRISSSPDEGALGVGLQESGIPRRGLITGLWQGLIISLSAIVAIFAGLYQAAFSIQQVLGPVGIVNLAMDTGQLGLIYLFQFLALISLNLAVLNLLPIPALDGGRLLFIAIEKIRGRRFLLGTEVRANVIGFALLIGLIILVTIKDVAGLF